MGLERLIGRLAAGAPVPVFAVAGFGAREPVQDLRLDDRLRFAETPSAATVLLIGGGIPDDLLEPLARLHDTLPHPRATAWWPLGAPAGPWIERFRHHVVHDGDIPSTLATLQKELLSGRRESEPSILPNEDPVEWRGVGPYGQGGTGMTGGTPYGRAMAELGPDRDGLRLDILPLRVGPFFPCFPAGLELELNLAGDILVGIAPPANPFTASATPGSIRPGLRPFARALSEPVPIVELELARAREHLRWVSRGLAAAGLPALSLRVLRLAHDITPGDGDSLRALVRTIGRTQTLGWATRGVGRIAPELLEGLGTGPVGRAAGLVEDARMDDLRYRDLGFEPIVQAAGDCAARWRQRLDEAAQSLELALRAGDRRTTQTGAVEGPRGRLASTGAPADRVLPLLPRLLEGMEWGDAVTTLVSLDLDLDEAAAMRTPSAEAVA